MEQQTGTTPTSNTSVHPTHTLLTEQDLKMNPMFARKHRFLARDIRDKGFLVCKNCGNQHAKNLGDYCRYYRPRTKPTRLAMAIKQICGSMPSPGGL